MYLFMTIHYLPMLDCFVFFCWASLEETANRIADNLSSKCFPATSGTIKVKTETWNSRDGLPERSEKSQTFGGIHALSRCDFWCFPL